MEWEVWLTDGTRRTSREMTWEALQAEGVGVLVVRYWRVPGLGDGVSWGEAFYGRPDTLLSAGWTDDTTFARVLAEAQATTVPPSERG